MVVLSSTNVGCFPEECRPSWSPCLPQLAYVPSKQAQKITTATRRLSTQPGSTLSSAVWCATAAFAQEPWRIAPSRRGLPSTSARGTLKYASTRAYDDRAIASFVRKSYVSALCPVVIRPYLCTCEVRRRRAARYLRP